MEKTVAFWVVALFFAVSVSVSASGEDLLYQVLRDTVLYDFDTPQINLERDKVGEVKQGEKVIFRENRRHLFRETTTDGVDIVTGYYKYDNRPDATRWDDITYEIDSNDLIPWETESLFYPSFITELNAPDRMSWVPEYYAAVLRSLNRDTVLRLDPGWAAWYPKGPGFFEEWYELFAAEPDIVDIANSALVFCGSVGLAVKSIQEIPDGYSVSVIFGGDAVFVAYSRFDWSLVAEKEVFDILLVVDGDYMDVYLEDLGHKLTTLISVDQHFLAELQNLALENTANLSGIKWPKRGYKVIETDKTYKTVGALRLRATENRDSETIATLPIATLVQVLEKGAEDTLDSIKANWVKVRLGDGTEGWCFGGYLSAFPVSPNPLPPPPEAAVDASRTPAKKAPLPWFTIGNGAVVLAGGVVLFLARKRKGRR